MENENESQPLVIADMVTMEVILEMFKNYSDAKRAKDIKDYCIQKFSDGTDVFTAPDKYSFIERQVTKLLADDKKAGDMSLLVYANGKYKKRKKKYVPRPVDIADAKYIGSAGECAVLSELMFRGYNANRMMIDDGIDIIASKNNLFFYIQVKTVSMDANGRLMAKISSDRFGYHMDSQLIYIVVTRIEGRKGYENLFFVFSHKDIKRMIAEGTMKQGQDNVIIKIQYDNVSGKPIAYDDNRADISFHMNNFDLI